MPREVLHPKALGRIAPQVFTQEFALQVRTWDPDSVGQPIETWATVIGREAIPCHVSPLLGSGRYLRQEQKLQWGTLTETDHLMTTPGDLRAVVATDSRLVGRNGTAYDILGVEVDSSGAMTRLFVRTVRT